MSFGSSFPQRGRNPDFLEKLGGILIEFSFPEIMLGEEMDEEMEDVFQKSFQCLEIDLEYEFDASRFFDFTRPESLAEARAAELWFETAASYPPSRKINPRK